MAKCKICNCDPTISGAVNGMLQDKETDKTVIEYLRNRGVEITLPSVKRHRLNCLKLKTAQTTPPVTKTDRVENEIYLDIKPLLDMARKKSPRQVLKILQDDVNISHVLLSEIVRNQLAITKLTQDKFIAGTGAYPTNAFKDLAVLIGLKDKFDLTRVVDELNSKGQREVKTVTSPKTISDFYSDIAIED